ncbi:MAG: serine/threonine-protein kinase [Polyangiaceae bacterium]
MSTASPLDAALERLFARPPAQRRIGRYRLRPEGKLGQGGFAPVFVADELSHASAAEDGAEEAMRTVALKLFPLDGQRAHITREGQALCRVKHDNVVTFNAMVTDEELGLVAIVMEHVEGTSLDARIAKGRLPVKDVLALGEQMASALEAIHAAGIIHRDLKPANIIEHGVVYTLIDFGISRGGAAAEPSAELDARGLFADLSGKDARALPAVLTDLQRTARATLVTHGIAGTLGYVDPRVVSKGVRADEKSDLYALGVTLFECASGALPTLAAAGETEISPEKRAEVAAMIFTGVQHPPSLSDVCPDVPLVLASLIDAMVSPDANDRPASASAVRERLAKVRASLAEAPEKPKSLAPPPRVGIEVGSAPLSPEEQRRRDEAIRRRDAKEQRAKWRNRVLALALLGGAAGGGYAIYKAVGGPSAKEQEARDAWADFQGCLLAAAPTDAASNVARWYVVRANIAIDAVDAKAVEDVCMPLGRTAYDAFRAARGPGADFLEKLTSYLEDVTHKSVTESDPIPMLNAGLDAKLTGGVAKTKSPVAAAAEAAIKLSSLESAKPFTAPEAPNATAACDGWMPPAKPALERYRRDVGFDKTTGLMFGKPAKDERGRRRRNGDGKDDDERWFDSIDTIVNLEGYRAERVCDYAMDSSTAAVAFVCNTPLFLLKRPKGVIELATTRDTGTVKPTPLFPSEGRSPLDARTSSIDVRLTCNTSTRTYFTLALEGGGSSRTLFGTWADGTFALTDLDAGAAVAGMNCLEGVGGWVVQQADKQKTLIYCPEGGECSPPKPLPELPKPSPNGAKDALPAATCFDGKSFIARVGDKFSVGVKKWAWPFDKPPTSTLVFANTPGKFVDLPMQLSCAGGRATLANDAGVFVEVSAEPRLLP